MTTFVQDSAEMDFDINSTPAGPAVQSRAGLVRLTKERFSRFCTQHWNLTS